MPRRRLGRTGERLSVIGFGGIVVMGKPQEHANRSVASAVDLGINYFDVAPSYGDAEDRLGPALEPYRRSVFLACKTAQRKADEATAELHASLKKLRTDHVDLYQLHAMKKLADVETAFGPHGAMEAFLKAREEGKTRFLGFSAHSAEAAMAAMDRFDFDTILFPVNYVAWWMGNFGPQVVERAREKEMGILTLKALAKGPWPGEAERTHPPCWYEPITDPEEAQLALRFSLSQSATAAVPPGNEELFWLALNLPQATQPLLQAEERRLRAMAVAATPLFRYPA
jgi:aryl-alcohol dehydrogenase-like predicted oxidoreductase